MSAATKRTSPFSKRSGHPLIDFLDRVITAIGLVAAWGLLVPLIGMRAYDIVAKQFIKTPSILFQVLEWNVFYLLIMLTLGFTYLRNGHVRVDILRVRFSPRAKAWMEITGFTFGLLPLWAVLTFYGGEFAWIAYENDERWLFGLGLWVKKAMLPFGASLLLLAGVVVVWCNLLFLSGRLPDPTPNGE